MGRVNQVLAAMRPDCVYRVCDIATICHIDTDEARRIINLLEKGGMVETESTDEYRRKKLVKTKQNDLFM